MPSSRCADLSRGYVGVCVSRLVVCFNHWERMQDILPLCGDVRALDLLRRLAVSRQSAKHASSQRRGVCDGIHTTTRACAWLSACALTTVVCACLFVHSGLTAFVGSLGPGVLAERGCNDYFLALALYLLCVCL